jgi:hypothetical protein
MIIFTSGQTHKKRGTQRSFGKTFAYGDAYNFTESETLKDLLKKADFTTCLYVGKATPRCRDVNTAVPRCQHGNAAMVR